jgi:hypothetical protein
LSIAILVLAPPPGFGESDIEFARRDQVDAISSYRDDEVTTLDVYK